MRRQGCAMGRGHSHGVIPEEQPSALPDAAVAELPGLFVDTTQAPHGHAGMHGISNTIWP